MSSDLVQLALVSAASAQVVKMLVKGQSIPQKEMVIPVVSALVAKYVLDKNLRIGFRTDADFKFLAVSLGAAYLSHTQIKL
jgi:hypothetical protein